VRVIQGDGIDLEMVRAIFARTAREGWSADNLAFGMGGALLQRLDRDTQRFAFKCSEVTVEGERRPVSKSPITDPSKNSKAGRLALLRSEGGSFRTVAVEDGSDCDDQLREVFRDGQLLVRDDLAAIRERAALPAT
jgi:nicotinamide phosphoribosyltransferase